MNVIKSENLTPRTTTIVGVSIAIGVGFSVVPDALALLPSWASTLFSGVPGTAIVAMVLSILLKESDN